MAYPNWRPENSKKDMTENKTTEETVSATSHSAPEEGDPSFARTLTQLFLVPALVVGACVVLFFFFGWMISEEKSSLDYLHAIKTGSANRRWQAAFELAKLLNHQPEKTRTEGLGPEMVDVFETAREDDPRVRRYLALALGHLGDAEAVPALLEALRDDDSETRIFSIWALGAIGDRRAVEPLMELVRHDDPGIRKMAAYSLGALKANEAKPALRAALDDPKVDVAWNAAIALAQLGDSSGRDRILQMLDRDFLETVEEMTEDQRTETMVTAMSGALLLGGEDLQRRLEEISERDPDLKVRQSAYEALAQMGTATRVPEADITRR